MEIGPWRVDGKGGLKLVDGGWEEYANVLYSTWLLIAVILLIFTLFI